MKTLTTLILSALAFTASAQAHLDVQTTVHKKEEFINEAGETERRMVIADVVVPGETVYYTITFRNVSEETADNVVITNPIAENLIYVDGSGFGPGTDMQFSIDGGKTFAVAGELTVVENGETRPAEARDFTHVRWVVKGDLGAGQQGTARFAAVLE